MQKVTESQTAAEVGLGPTSSNMKQNHLLLDSSENLPRIKSNQWSFHSIHIKLQYENTDIGCVSGWHQICHFSAIRDISNQSEQHYLKSLIIRITECNADTNYFYECEGHEATWDEKEKIVHHCHARVKMTVDFQLTTKLKKTNESPWTRETRCIYQMGKEMSFHQIRNWKGLWGGFGRMYE